MFTEYLRERSILRHHAQKLISNATEAVPDAAIVLVRDKFIKESHDLGRMRDIQGEQHTLHAHVQQLHELPAGRDLSMVIGVNSTMPRQLQLRVGARVQLTAKVGELKTHTLATVVSIDLNQSRVTVKADSTGREETVGTMDELVGVRSESSVANGTSFDAYELWSQVPLRLAYAFTPRQAAGLPAGKFHVLMTNWELSANNFNFDAFSRALGWDDVSWDLPSGVAPETPEDLARKLGLALVD